MALLPFFEVTTKEDINITDFITNFSFTDTVKGESTLSLDFKDKDIEFTENEFLKNGQEFNFVFGYKNGSRSSKRIAVVTDQTPVFGAIISVSIKARDKGILLKKNNAQTVYKDKKASDIVTEIADKLGFGKEIEESITNYPFYAQGNKSDMELLRELAKKNDFTFFVRDTTLHFKKTLLKDKSVRTFTYKDPNDIVSSFSPKVSYTNQSNAAKSVTVQGIDPQTNELYNETIKTEDLKDDVKLGKEEAVTYGFDGGVTRNNTPQTSPPTESSTQLDVQGQILTTGHTDKAEAVKEATKVVKKAQLSSIEADLDLSILEPLLFAGDIITIAGVGKIFNGNYLIEEISHSVSVGSAKTSMKLKRNATSKSVTKTQTEVPKTTETNTTVGSETTAETTAEPKRVIYGNNGSVTRP